MKIKEIEVEVLENDLIKIPKELKDLFLLKYGKKIKLAYPVIEAETQKEVSFFVSKDGFEDSLLISFDIPIEIIKEANINPESDVVIDISDKIIKIYEDNNTEEKDLFFEIDKKY